MNKIILALILLIFTSSVFASDEKAERFFEDQPDVTDQPQVHFIYLLNIHQCCSTTNARPEEQSVAQIQALVHPRAQGLQ